MARVQLFLSTVSAEFLSYRERLRHLLTRPDVEVKIQEDFIVTGDETLEMLDHYIQGCDGVIHLVGDMTGSMANAPSVAATAATHPELASRFQLAEFMQPDGPCLSYTQWEAWLALLHGKRLFIAKAATEAPRDKRYRVEAKEQELQQAHLERLRSVGRHPGTTFSDSNDLAANVLRSFVLDLLLEVESYIPRPSSSSEPTRTISIFLASSSELKEDRDAFDLYFRQENDRLLKQGVYLRILHRENFLDAASETGLQSECNLAIQRSDIFVSLFKTKTGRCTVEAFDAAHKSCSEFGKPLIYTFFKSVQVSINTLRRESLLSLWEFQDKLSGLGYYHTQYNSAEDLKLQFKRQLDKIFDEGKLFKGSNLTLMRKRDRVGITQKDDQLAKEPVPRPNTKRSSRNDPICFCESDLVNELEIIQEMEERGVIKKDNAIALQSQKIAELRFLRASKS
jgi:hypothetical protein